jgi:ubiquinone/menaquinone biosynthesis C-methylase UbiE
MLDDLVQRAAKGGVTNIAPERADAEALPYRDQAFDAAFLISVLGELPDAIGALRELRRVLKPDGRLVVGEVFVDPDFVSLRNLAGKAAAAGFDLVRSAGPRASYLALLRPAAG